MNSSDICIKEVNTEQKYADDVMNLKVDVSFDKPSEKRYKLTLTVVHAFVGEKKIYASTSLTRSLLINESELGKEVVFQIEKPKLWTSEEENLYNVDIVLKPAGIPTGGAAALAINKIEPIDSKTVTIALRGE